MDFRVSLVDGLLELKNPVLSAAGTFGSGLEYRPYGDITQLGAIIVNGLTLRPCAGAPLPGVADIHFDYRLALAAIEAGVDKIRRTPATSAARTACRRSWGRQRSAVCPSASA